MIIFDNEKCQGIKHFHNMVFLLWKIYYCARGVQRKFLYLATRHVRSRMPLTCHCYDQILREIVLNRITLESRRKIADALYLSLKLCTILLCARTLLINLILMFHPKTSVILNYYGSNAIVHYMDTLVTSTVRYYTPIALPRQFIRFRFLFA